ncbi:hypothetical protein KSP40_PGU002066 [Platanthera guangdongensis]|uniref:25S rRNA (uridine-N(3))-methyltransferase BMT5-like domain-containing protein n=1 Tax=Platanthera guangdongensis TaxID=2320717 RepID=A0ABR2LZT1_9ASPA
MEATVAFYGEKTGSNVTAKKEKSIMHYSNAHSILLVGEGDFSFSACLARSFGSAVNMVATSRDNEVDLMKKHRDAKNHLDELKGLGCKLLYGIDVKDMQDDPFLKTKRFDRIIFNFPHAGHDPMYRECDEELILRHRELLSNFFSSAKCLLRESGEIHVAHRDDGHYAQWRIQSLARRNGLFLKEVVQFDKKDYPGYHNKRGGEE